MTVIDGSNETVGIILPTRNRSRLLARCIESILSQTHTKFKLFILDNSSTDDTQVISEFYSGIDRRVIYIRHNHDIGAFRNFEFGLNIINKSFFCLISDDDFLLPHFLKESLKALTKYPSAGFSIMETLYINQEQELLDIPQCLNGLVTLREDSRRILFENTPMTWTAMMFREDIRNIFLSESNYYDKANDIAMLRAAAARFPYVYTAKAGACFTCHPNSFSSEGFPVSERIAYYCISLNRYAKLVTNEKIDKSMRRVCHAEILETLNKGIKLYIIGNAISSLKSYIQGPRSARKYQDVLEYIQLLKEAGLHIQAFLLRRIISKGFPGKLILFAATLMANIKQNSRKKRMAMFIEKNLKSEYAFIKSIQIASIRKYQSIVTSDIQHA